MQARADGNPPPNSGLAQHMLDGKWKVMHFGDRRLLALSAWLHMVGGGFYQHVTSVVDDDKACTTTLHTTMQCKGWSVGLISEKRYPPANNVQTAAARDAAPPARQHENRYCVRTATLHGGGLRLPVSVPVPPPLLPLVTLLFGTNEVLYVDAKARTAGDACRYRVDWGSGGKVNVLVQVPPGADSDDAGHKRGNAPRPCEGAARHDATAPIAIPGIHVDRLFRMGRELTKRHWGPAQLARLAAALGVGLNVLLPRVARAVEVFGCESGCVWMRIRSCVCILSCVCLPAVVSLCLCLLVLSPSSDALSRSLLEGASP